MLRATRVFVADIAARDFTLSRPRERYAKVMLAAR